MHTVAAIQWPNNGARFCLTQLQPVSQFCTDRRPFTSRPLFPPQVNIFEMRSYIFSRQAAMLMKLDDPVRNRAQLDCPSWVRLYASVAQPPPPPSPFFSFFFFFYFGWHSCSWRHHNLFTWVLYAPLFSPNSFSRPGDGFKPCCRLAVAERSSRDDSQQRLCQQVLP